MTYFEDENQVHLEIILEKLLVGLTSTLSQVDDKEHIFEKVNPLI
jgi:hypothetical protein